MHNSAAKALCMMRPFEQHNFCKYDGRDGLRSAVSNQICVIAFSTFAVQACAMQHDMLHIVLHFLTMASSVLDLSAC